MHSLYIDLSKLKIAIDDIAKKQKEINEKLDDLERQLTITAAGIKASSTLMEALAFNQKSTIDRLMLCEYAIEKMAIAFGLLKPPEKQNNNDDWH